MDPVEEVAQEAVQLAEQKAVQLAPEEWMASILGFLFEACCPSTTFLFAEELSTEQGKSLSFFPITPVTIALINSMLQTVEFL